MIQSKAETPPFCPSLSNLTRLMAPCRPNTNARQLHLYILRTYQGAKKNDTMKEIE